MPLTLNKSIIFEDFITEVMRMRTRQIVRGAKSERVRRGEEKSAIVLGKIQEGKASEKRERRWE